MTSSPVAPRTLRRAMLAGAAAATAAFGMSALAAPAANAAFTLGRCEGSGSVRGQGASFQNGAQAYFKRVFEDSNGCGGTPTGPTYAANGSGNGIASAGGGGGNANLLCVVAATCTSPLDPGVRDLSVAYQATDEPPSTTQQAAMNAGTASAADDALVHVVPVATGSNTFQLHAPEGCDLSDVVDQTNGRSGTIGNLVETGDGAADHTERIRLRNALLEKAFAGASDADTWGEIAPGIRGVATGIDPGGDQTNEGLNCTDVPVRRIVRQDVSGTTYGWKAYLNLINRGRGWLTTYSTPNNLTWPRAGGSGTTTPVRAQGAACLTTGDKLCSGASSGNGSLADAMNATDGSIGYGDLATARSKGFEVTPDAVRQDYTFWSPLENNPGGAATGYVEPSSDPLAHKPGVGGKGSNCANVAVANVPTAAGSPNGDPTLGDWSQVYAAGGSNYGACVLTYILAWDDNAVVYGNTPAEEAEARTVKDYLNVILSGFGQQFLLADYSALPNSVGTPLLDVAQDGVDAIGWNKTAGAGGGGGGGGGGSTPTPTPTPSPGPSTPPSNQFSIPSSSVRAGAMSFTLELPGGGMLRVLATARAGRRTIQVASATARSSASGKVRVNLTLSRAARRALARARGRRLVVTVTFTYTPTGGSARTVTKRVTVRAAARRGRGRRARRGRR